MQISDDNFRKKILEIILKNNNLIINSKLIFWILFSKYNLNIPEEDEDDEKIPENEKDNDYYENYTKQFMKFIDTKNKNLELLNNQKNIFLDEILISLFEIYINSYINELDNKQLIKGLIIKYLEKSIKILTGEIKGNLNHLGILYAISFIRCYFYKLSNIIYSIAKNDEDLININNINKLLLMNNNISVRNVIKIYMLKCFYSKMQNYNEFKNFEWDKSQIVWAKDFIENKENEPISNLQNLFLNVSLDIEVFKI